MFKIPELGTDEDYWALRRCCLPPIEEHYIAASLISEAADFYLAGDHERAKERIIECDMPILHDWSDALWGLKKYVTESEFHYIHRRRNDPHKPTKATEKVPRSQSVILQRELLARDGYHCRFCSMPLVGKQAAGVLRKAYPETIRWGGRNREKHPVLHTMKIEFDHIVPHALGGGDTIENMVVACGPCNCAREDHTLAEYGLHDPRDFPTIKSDWDGLTRIKKD